MNERSLKILYHAINYQSLTEHRLRLVIVQKDRDSIEYDTPRGPYVSFNHLTAEDFYEIYRYKRDLEKKGR